MDRRSCEDDMPSGICESCGRYVTAHVVDEGIGPYEYWGSKGEHHDYHTCSPCCDADVVNGEEHLVSDTIHTARRDHKNSDIRIGDRYRKLVYISWINGSKRFYNVIKKKLPQEQPKQEFLLKRK